MPHLIVVILDDMKRMPGILQAWQSIGVTGVTIFESTGGYRSTTWLSQVGLQFLDKLFEEDEIRRRTLIAAIDGEDLLEQAVAEAERVLDGFERPESGVLLVLPIELAKGLNKVKPIPNQEKLPPVVRSGWMDLRNKKVEDLVGTLVLEPIIVGRDAQLAEVARIMLNSPDVRVACVVAEDERLLGLLSLRNLADDLFLHILPEEFLSESFDLEHVKLYADMLSIRNVGDAMGAPVWVKRSDTVKDAFKRMHENELPGLPVVDNRYHVTGYINLLELLNLFLEQNANGNISEDTL